MKRYLITSALPYSNGYVHFGHLAGAYLPADMYARFLRLRGEKTLYVCGSDEHGVAITIAADKEKTTPRKIIDKYHEANKEAFRKFAMSFDIYSRTSQQIHHDTAREFFGDFLAKGLLVEKEEEQFYDSTAMMFLPDRYVEGICPNCGFEQARGDQCDSCGAYYNQLELQEPRSLITGKTPEVKKTVHWYMKFGEFQKFLEGYIEGNSKTWKDNVLQQSRSWLKQGLNDRAITRDLEWGVSIKKIPGVDPEKSKGKVLYVWFDAVLGYISITKEWAIERANSQNGSRDDWKQWWQDKDTNYTAFIGKDNIVFHTLIFPAMLHAREGYNLPDNVPANEFLNLEGEKFSKSRNWSIDLKDFLSDFHEFNYIDALRYTLAMNLPETRDSDFTWKDFQTRNNCELAAIYGNFVNRSMQFISKNFSGRVPFISGKYNELPRLWDKLVDFLNSHDKGNDTELLEKIPSEIRSNIPDNEFNLIWALWKGVRDAAGFYQRFRFRDALTETMNIARAANKYFNDEAPWKTMSEDNEKAAKTLFFCAQLCRSLSILFAPVVPYACRRICGIFEIEPETGKENNAVPLENLWNKATLPLIPENHKIVNPQIIFTKIEDETVIKQVEKLKKASIPVLEEVKKIELIDIDLFKKIELRTAKIIEAERVPKSKKLLKLKADLGTEKRQILAGIAEHYQPEELVGKTVVVVANLQPAKLMGLESQGMVLAASADGKLRFLTQKDDLQPGAEVR